MRTRQPGVLRWSLTWPVDFGRGRVEEAVFAVTLSEHWDGAKVQQWLRDAFKAEGIESLLRRRPDEV